MSSSRVGTACRVLNICDIAIVSCRERITVDEVKSKEEYTKLTRKILFWSFFLGGLLVREGGAVFPSSLLV
jgi:hypothetical protein